MKTILVTGAVSLLLALFGTPLVIRVLRRQGYGQPIRVEGPKSHETKRGTPTMGGTVMVLAALVGYVVGHLATHDPMSASGLLVLFLMAGLGLVGFIDDFIKISRQTSLGLRSGAKLAGQVVVGAVFALEVGLFLVVFPWQDSWTFNYFQGFNSNFESIWDEPSFKGLVTGLGFVNIYIGLLQVIRLFRRSTPSTK